MNTTTQLKTTTTDLMTFDTKAFEVIMRMITSGEEAAAVKDLNLYDSAFDDAYFRGRGLVEKAAYIDHKRVVQRCIRLLATQQIADRKITGDGKVTDADRQAAHNRRAFNADRITRLIALRRAGKLWSSRLVAKERRIAQQAELKPVLEMIWSAGFNAEAPALYFAKRGIASKADYLAHRDQLCGALKGQVELQVNDKAIANSKGGTYSWMERSGAQARCHSRAASITALIALRRAGKVWSAAQRAAQMLARDMQNDAA